MVYWELMRTRVKICGITRPEDARTAGLLGVDAIGLVFYDRSPRRLDAARAAEVVAALPPFVSVVALFVDADEAEIRKVLDQVRIDVLQFHGDEPADVCSGFGVPWIKAVRMRPGVDLISEAQHYAGARALLLDTWRQGVPGGTGERFAWQALPEGLGLPVLLAGGLTPDNVGEGMGIVRPFGVDVSGGVESAGGIKDAGRMRAFVDAVSTADRKLMNQNQMAAENQ